MEANIICLFCEASYHMDRHHCIQECFVQGDKVWHFDFCIKCRQILRFSFEKQM